MKRFVFFLLFLAASALSLLVLKDIADPPPKTGLRALAQPTGDAPAAQRTDAAPDSTPQWVATITARPLFEASRRPPAERAAADAAPDQRTPLPRVSGVIVSQSGRSAIFAGSGGARPIVAAEGAKIGDYTVQSIKVGEVVVSGPDGVHTLHPTFDPALRNSAAQQGGAPSVPFPTAASPQVLGRFGLPNLPGLPAQPDAQPQQIAPGNPFVRPNGFPGIPFQPNAPQPSPFQPGAFQNKSGTNEAPRRPFPPLEPSLANAAQAGQYANR